MTKHSDTATVATETAVTVDDPRVQDLAENLGLSPQDVITEASAQAATDGVTVGEELDAAEDVVTIMSAFEENDGTAFGDDGDDV